MAIQAFDRIRCVSCNRWAGARKPGTAPGEVEYDEHNDKGACIDGPWHGTLRGPRNACGQWIQWIELKLPER